MFGVKANEGVYDRMARVVLAAGLFLTALFWVGGALSVLEPLVLVFAHFTD